MNHIAEYRVKSILDNAQLDTKGRAEDRAARLCNAFTEASEDGFEDTRARGVVYTKAYEYGFYRNFTFQRYNVARVLEDPNMEYEYSYTSSGKTLIVKKEGEEVLRVRTDRVIAMIV